METNVLAKKLGWKSGQDYPEWGNNALYLTTIQGGYLLEDETPRVAYERLALAAAKRHKDLPINTEELNSRFFEILWNGWLIPSTPVMSNLGTERGMPISCFSGVVGDDMFEINRKCTEMSMLSKHGGGTAYDFSAVRPIGSPIKGGLNGTSDGIIPFIKHFDTGILCSKQGSLRRGAVAIYLNAKHEEYEDFLRIREPKGDIDRQCHNIHQGAIFDDDFMNSVDTKKGRERELWIKTLMTRVKTGEPYTMFIDNANRHLPKNWKQHGLKIRHSNLCSEIFLCTDENHTLVCCLSSLNLLKWDEFKDDTIYLSILFLDAVIDEFIEKARNVQGIEDSVRFAEKSRALGLGTLGWHSYLQSKHIPFVGIQATALTKTIFSKIKKEAEKATLYLGEYLDEPEWCKGTGRRNLTLMAIAPNRSSASLAGGISQGIEPVAANIYIDDSAKGTHIRRNPQLSDLLDSKERNIPEVWDQISEDRGSVKNIRCLSKEEKEVFKTFKEINQLELVRQAAIRQKYIDQGQSINLAFFQDAPAKFINQVHIEAWRLGLKSLYYLRSESNLRADSAQQRDLYTESCRNCEG